MAAPTGVWGIDVGQFALKAMRVELIDGAITATHFDYIEYPKILSQPDADPDQLTREALEKFLSGQSIRKDQVVISVPGQSGLARFVKLPPVEEKKIGEIVKFEAKQQIPFPLEEVVWDYQRLGEGIVSDGFAMDTEIGLFAMKRDMISRFMGHFQAVNVEVHVVQMAPLALCNYMAFETLNNERDEDEDETPAGKKRCIVGVDIGTDNSNLVITDGKKIIWQRPIPLGGNHFTRALTKEMKLTFAKAEHLKRNCAKSKELPQILKALRPVLQEFVNEVQRSLGYFTNTHRDAHVAYMVLLGSASKLPGMKKFIQEKLSLDVKQPTKFDRLSGESVTEQPLFIENLLAFPVVYGLCMQGVGLSRLQTNLLPPEIRTERLIRAKKPWAAAAAAMLLAGTAGLCFGYSVGYKEATVPEIAKGITDSKNAIALADGKQREYDEGLKKVDETKRDVLSIIAGTDEKVNWVELIRYINSCLPNPKLDRESLKKLPPADFARLAPFYNTNEAQRAIARQAELLKGGNPDEQLPDNLRAELPQIDLEAVQCLYTNDLKATFTKIKENVKKIGNSDEFAGMEPDELERIKKDEFPEGSGWVVELRGATYKNRPTASARQFVLNTLVHNLNNLHLGGKPRPAPAPPAARPGVPAAAGKVEKEDPIFNKISYVFLYDSWEDKTPEPGVFKDRTSPQGSLNRSILGEVVVTGPAESTPGVPGAAPGTGGAPVAPPGGPAYPGSRGGEGGVGGSTGSSWVPLGSGAMPSGSSTSSTSPRGTPSTPPTSGTTTTTTEVKKPRYEFVILFIWREPTPSDKLMEAQAGPGR